jgi:hypothetical protein
MEVNKSELPKNSEQWAAIDGYKNYQVSWWGRVRNATTGRIYKNSITPNGYLVVGLTKNKVKKTHNVHQLVAREWVSNPEEKRCVDHRDGDRTNNHYENLRYATYTENNRNAKHRTDGASAYKGVSWVTKTKKWWAEIGLNRKRIFLGNFTDEREAGEAYNAAAVEHYKEFAKINVFED